MFFSQPRRTWPWAVPPLRFPWSPRARRRVPPTAAARPWGSWRASAAPRRKIVGFVSVLNTGFVQVRRFMKIFRRFCKTQPCLHDFCIVLVLSVARSSIQWPIFELLRQARSSIICLWDCNQLQIGGRNDHKKSVSRSDSHFSVSMCFWVFYQ